MVEAGGSARNLTMSSMTRCVFHMQHATCNLRYYFEYLMGSTYPPTDKFEAVSDITGQAACSVFVPPRSWRIIFRFRGRLFDRLIDFNHVYVDNTKLGMELHGMEGGGGGVLIGGGERVGAMLVYGKTFQISAKKGGWVLQMVQKVFSP